MTEQRATKLDNTSTSEALEAVLGQLSPEQIRYAIARRESRSITDACAAIGMSRAAFYKWPEDERAMIDEAVRLMALDGLVTAMHLRRRALAEAMAVKVAGLRSKDERVRQATATELIEWELGKATQRNEVTGAEGGPVRLVWDDNTDVTPFASGAEDGLG
jgi:hypothetical protein